MIQHLFLTMMHFVSGLLMRVVRRQPLISQKLNPLQSQVQIFYLFKNDLDLTHRKDQRSIMPLPKRFRKVQGLHHGNDGKVYSAALKSDSPGRRYALDLGQTYLKKVDYKMLGIKTNDAPKIMKFIPMLSDDPLLIRS